RSRRRRPGRVRERPLRPSVHLLRFDESRRTSGAIHVTDFRQGDSERPSTVPSGGRSPPQPRSAAVRSIPRRFVARARSRRDLVPAPPPPSAPVDALVDRSILRFTIPGARALVCAAFAATLLVPSTPSTPTEAAEISEAAQVIQIARAQVGDPYHYGVTGPSAFDCSGLVIYAYKTAGDLALIGNGNYRSAAALYSYFRNRGLTSRTNATPGDLVV